MMTTVTMIVMREVITNGDNGIDDDDSNDDSNERSDDNDYKE